MIWYKGFSNLDPLGYFYSEVFLRDMGQIDWFPTTEIHRKASVTYIGLGPYLIINVFFRIASHKWVAHDEYTAIIYQAILGNLRQDKGKG